MRPFFALLVILVVAPAFAQRPTWYVLSREKGCVDPKVLLEYEQLPRAPASPDQYAQMMRDRGNKVTVGFPPDMPPEYHAKIVQVKVGNDDGGPVFADEEVCRRFRR